MTNKDRPGDGNENPDKALTDEEAVKKFPKQAKKLTKPEEPPPTPRSTDPRRKQR